MDQTKIDLLKARLQTAWSAASSNDPSNWTITNPSYGQCAVTACVVQEELGGDVVWADAVLPNGKTSSHYWNIIDGQQVDLTRDQFPEGTMIPEGQPKTKNFPTTQEYILSFEVTYQRYRALKENLSL